MISSKGKSSRLRSRTSDIYLCKNFNFRVTNKTRRLVQHAKKKRQNMPKARKSTRNSDAMDAEGHEEVRDVFVVFTASSRFFYVLF
jgi:uncharacterized protein YlaI